MKKIKIDSNHILIGIFILITGVLLGVIISTRGTFALEGDSTATSTSATSTNATATNATPVNATATNATSTNASRTDNILYLNNFSLAVESAKPGEKVYIGKMTTGACNSGMSIEFVNYDNNNHFKVNVENMNDVPYFVVPKNISSGTYQANTIFLVGLNSNGSTFNKKYTYKVVDSTGSTDFYFDVKLKINNENTSKLALNKISLNEKEVLVGEKVNVNYESTETLTNLRLFFKSANESFNVTVLNLEDKPYFNIPSTVKVGEYKLVKAILMSDNSSIVYEQESNYSFDIKLDIKENEHNTYIYNNSDITEDIIKKLYDDNEVSDIIINIDDNSLVSEDLFKVIIGTDRRLVINTGGNQLIFNGKDIKNSKSIDANMTTSVTSDDDKLSNIINDGIVVNFVSNGNLPGNALVRLKISNAMKNKFGNSKVYVYYYDEVANGFNTIANGITPKDGYYEFTISHNSKYVITQKALSNNLIIEEEDNNIVGFRQSDNAYLFTLCGALLLILIVIIVILVTKNKKGKN